MTPADHLYLIESSTGHVKIGRSIYPRKRMQGIQSTVPGDLKLLMVIPLHGNLEKSVHRQFKAHRTHGEWFHDVPEIRSFFANAGGVPDVAAPPKRTNEDGQVGHLDPLIPALEAARNAAGLTDHALATRAGIPYSNYRRAKLAGTFSMPNLHALARELDVTLADLFRTADTK